MDLEIIGAIDDIEVIAIGNNIQDLARLQKQYGKGRWRKPKGIAFRPDRFISRGKCGNLGLKNLSGLQRD
jgi:hypothetical protein